MTLSVGEQSESIFKQYAELFLCYKNINHLLIIV